MMHATPAEIEVLISNIHMAELAGNWKEENKQSLFVTVSYTHLTLPTKRIV